MASSSTIHSISTSSSRSCKYDVFLSFRGEDVRQTFTDHLYESLERHLITTFKDDVKLPRGEPIRQSLFDAIEDSYIALVVFSKNYADSSWCLDELTHIMKCKEERGLIVIPIFYDVDPSDVRKQKNDFGAAFAKQEAEHGNKAQSWRNALVKASDISGLELKYIANGLSKAIDEIVKAISDQLFSFNYDGLKPYLQNLFLDIACFWRSRNVYEAMKSLEACGFSPKYGINVLEQHALISIVDGGGGGGGKFNMHNLVQEMGHHIVRGEHPNNPEKHSRVWEYEKIRDLCLGNETTLQKDNEIIQAIRFHNNPYHGVPDLSSCFCNTISNMKSLRWLSVKTNEHANGPTFLSNELMYLEWSGYPASSFPDNFQPKRLNVLKLHSGMQRELWKGCKHLPHLKELSLSSMFNLASTPEFSGLPCLQELRLIHCDLLEEIHPSLAEIRSLKSLTVVRCTIKRFPTCRCMDNLKTLEIVDCDLEDGDIPSGIDELSNLEELDLRENHFSRLDFSLSKLTRLKLLNVSRCKRLLKLPKLPSNIAIIKADYCFSLGSIEDCDESYKCLREVSLRRSSIINDGSRLLQSMIEGEGVETGCMILNLPGVEVANGFIPALLRGRRFRLQLQENWWDDSSGFLICAVVPSFFDDDPLKILIETSGMDSKDDDVVWVRHVGDGKMETWVRYVSFGSLRETPWWKNNQTLLIKALHFTILSKTSCVAVGAKLVRMETSGDSSIMNKFSPQVKIHHDHEEGTLTISLLPMAEHGFDDPEMHYGY